MFKIKNKTFYVTRGDRGSFELSFQDYQFKNGDVIEFKVYEKNGLDSLPLLTKSKTVTASEGSTLPSVTIDILGGDTSSLAEPANKVIELWYEIILNGDQTVFCYDENGPKIFYLYPGGVDE